MRVMLLSLIIPTYNEGQNNLNSNVTWEVPVEQEGGQSLSEEEPLEILPYHFVHTAEEQS